MSFTMDKDGHEIKMTNDAIYGLEILDIKCPYKERLETIADWWYGEAQRFLVPFTTSKIDFTYRRFKELLDLLQFKENHDISQKNTIDKT